MKRRKQICNWEKRSTRRRQRGSTDVKRVLLLPMGLRSTTCTMISGMSEGESGDELERSIEIAPGVTDFLISTWSDAMEILWWIMVGSSRDLGEDERRGEGGNEGRGRWGILFYYPANRSYMAGRGFGVLLPRFFLWNHVECFEIFLGGRLAVSRLLARSPMGPTIILPDRTRPILSGLS